MNILRILIAAAVVGALSARLAAFQLQADSTELNDKQSGKVTGSDSARKCPEGMIAIPGAMSSSRQAQPLHPTAFCLDQFEVTVAQYAACVKKGSCTAPNPEGPTGPGKFKALCNWGKPQARAEHPVNCVTHEQSRIYCATQGRRLPNEAQWQWAASNGGTTSYPWGDSPPDGKHVNGCGRECPAAMRHLAGDETFVAQYTQNDGYTGTAPVGRFALGANRWGVHDLAGNVAEFIEPTHSTSSSGDLTAGGGFLTQDPRQMSATRHSRTAWSNASSPDLGFRCAAD